MKKILLTLTFLTVNYTVINAQSTVAVGEYSLQTLREDLRLNKFDGFNTNKEEYFSVEFKNARVSGFKEKEKLRYNAYIDQFEFLRDGYLYKLDRMLNQTIYFDNGEIYKNCSFLYNDKLENRYLKILGGLEEKFTLYKRLIVDSTDALGTNGFNSTDANGKRYSKEDKLLIGQGEKLFSVPGNVKKLNVLLGVEVDDLVKSNKLNLKKEEDLKKLIDLLNK